MFPVSYLLYTTDIQCDGFKQMRSKSGDSVAHAACNGKVHTVGDVHQDLVRPSGDGGDLFPLTGGSLLGAKYAPRPVISMSCLMNARKYNLFKQRSAMYN